MACEPALGAIQETSDDASNETAVAVPLAESPPPQGASGRASGHGLVDLSPALPSFARGPSVLSLGALPRGASNEAVVATLPVAESPSLQVNSSLPSPSSESSCQVSMASGGDTGAQASDHTSPLPTRLFDSVGRAADGYILQTDTSPSNPRPPDQRTAATKATGGEQQAAPTEKQAATTEDLMANLKRLQEQLDKKIIREKESEEEMHMMKAQTMRARAPPSSARGATRAIHARVIPRRVIPRPCYHARPCVPRRADEMVEDIEDGRCKVLFMTNRQAELVSKESDCIEKLLDALDVPKPGLVIDLLHSWGFYDSTTLQERTLIRTLTPSLNPP